MALQANITNISGQTPFYIFICEKGGDNCIYVDVIETNNFQFTIPSPYDKLSEYSLKIIDGNNKTLKIDVSVQV
jgi:flagellar assembly factor FliW